MMTNDIDIGSLQLGKGPAKVDPRTLRLENYILPEVPQPPPSVDNSEKVTSWGALGNNQFGDCVVAAHGHNLMLWAAMAQIQFGLSDQETEQLYFFLTNGVDSGLVVLDTLNWLRKNIWKNREILGFASIDPRNILYIQHGISMFGSVYRGILLPRTAQTQVGGTWDFVNAPGNQPGSWGGHAVIDVGYDTSVTKCITWGMIQRATWNFWQSYCDEAYVIIPTDKIPGFDQDAFIRDLQALGQYFGPSPNPIPPSPPSPPPTPALTDYVDQVSLHYHSGKSISVGGIPRPA